MESEYYYLRIYGKSKPKHPMFEIVSQDGKVLISRLVGKVYAKIVLNAVNEAYIHGYNDNEMRHIFLKD